MKCIECKEDIPFSLKGILGELCESCKESSKEETFGKNPEDMPEILKEILKSRGIEHDTVEGYEVFSGTVDREDPESVELIQKLSVLAARDHILDAKKAIFYALHDMAHAEFPKAGLEEAVRQWTLFEHNMLTNYLFKGSGEISEELRDFDYILEWNLNTVVNCGHGEENNDEKGEK